MSARSIRIGASALATLLFGGLTLPPAAADETLVSVETTPVTMPGPGHTSTWTMRITRLARDPVELGLVLGDIQTEASGLLDDLTVTLIDDDGTVLASGRPDEISGSEPVSLGLLSAPSTLVAGTIALDADAGDDTQGVGATFDLRVVATPADAPSPSTDPAPGDPSGSPSGAGTPGNGPVPGDPPPDPGPNASPPSEGQLPWTGVQVGGMLALAGALIAVGALLARRARRAA